ncbi:MAG TPA: hemolysin family protein [Actinocrinis sp.]|uniref:hemolysin family protein n=1 Tax=Actinocrinis sp. TaxID=1920516 RepID=UPI002DDD64C0|nr:hemolysin family protein [Actinocrinis sp.]HEV2343535.1 hemolysin family protein [Actinocrinis sp.]
MRATPAEPPATAAAGADQAGAAHAVNSTIASSLVVLALILIEALFVASEIALVSLREGQLQALATSGKRGSTVVRLVGNPNRFLATVQIGVTLTALLSSAYGATTLSEDAKRALVRAGLASGLAGFIGLVGVTMIISFVTLVIGELAPKRLALQRAESTSKAVAPFLQGMARLCRPVIWLLSVCTDGIVRLFGGDPAASREQVSEEELRQLVASTETLTSDERRLIDEVFGAGDRQLREVLVPRTEVVFLDGAMPLADAAALIGRRPHSRYPVTDGSSDNVAGFVHVRDLLAPDTAQQAARVADLARPVIFLPETKHVLSALSEMRRDSFHLAIVLDEYGGTAGIVTLEDLVEEVIGDIRDEYDIARARVTRLRDGDLELDGLINLEDFHEETGIELTDGPYETLAGYIMARLGRVPAVGDQVTFDGLKLTVHAMDGRRISRVRLSRTESAGSADVAPDAARGAQQDG